MSSISVTVDGISRAIEADQRPTHIFAEAKEIVVCKVNGVLKDLWTELAEGDLVEGVSISSLKDWQSFDIQLPTSWLKQYNKYLHRRDLA
jgi:hypothetical protein